MGESPGPTFAVAFALALVPFGLWTWWMVRAEHTGRGARPSVAGSARVHPLPVAEPMPHSPFVRVGSFCRVPGSIGLGPSGATLVCTASARGARPRWRRPQTAA